MPAIKINLQALSKIKANNLWIKENKLIVKIKFWMACQIIVRNRKIKKKNWMKLYVKRIWIEYP